MTLSIEILPALSDNYIYLLKDSQSNSLAVIDPGDAAPVLKWAEETKNTVSHIFLTHHHYDHIDGVKILKEKFNPLIYAPFKNKDQIPFATNYITEDDEILFANEKIQIIETPGHTIGHVVYFLRKQQLLFSGDTLFAMGCGRLFEGSAADMYSSFQKIKTLPSDTKIYCGHEYSLTNARFAVGIFPKNEKIKARLQDIEEKRRKNQNTMGFTLANECKTNPFMLARSVEEFAEFRELRNSV